MQIQTYIRSRRVALFLHGVFSSIYLLLVTRAAIALHEGPPDLSHYQQNSLFVVIIKRTCGVLYHPFYAVLLAPSFEGNADLIVTIIFAISAYAFIHHVMLTKGSIQESNSMVDKILKLCRATCFLAATLLLLLIVARMSVMLYQDVHFGRIMIGIGPPAKK